MTNKEKYRLFCQEETEIPIFSKDWWLDGVCGKDNWNVELIENGGKIVASLPYLFLKKGPLRLIKMPPLTQSMGVYIKYPKNQTHYKKLSWEKKLVDELIIKLPNCHYFSQNFHYSKTNWLPFYWKGFKQTTRYTYLLDLTNDLDFIWSNFKSSVRGKIRKAKKLVEIKKGLPIEDFYKLNNKTFERQGIKIPYCLDLLRQKEAILIKMKSREIFYAIDSKKNIHSCLYLIWDSKSAYVHMVGEDPNYRNSGAGIFLIWEVIKYSKDHLNLEVFDFEGSMIQGVEEVRRSCGGIQTPYSNIKKINNPFLRAFLSFTNKI